MEKMGNQKDMRYPFAIKMLDNFFGILFFKILEYYT